MSTQSVRLIERSGVPIGVAEVVDKGTHYGGRIDLSHMSPQTRAVFAEFEEIVTGQMFSFLDEIDDKIEAIGAVAVFADGRQVPVRDLQICPSSGSISFREPLTNSASATNGASTKLRDSTGRVVGEFRPT